MKSYNVIFYSWEWRITTWFSMVENEEKSKVQLLKWCLLNIKENGAWGWKESWKGIGLCFVSEGQGLRKKVMCYKGRLL